MTTDTATVTTEQKPADTQAAPTTETVSKPAETVTAAPTDGTKAPAGDTKTTESKGYWPEDWQAKTAEQIGVDKWDKGQQEAFKKQFGRMPSPAEMAKSWWSATAKLNDLQGQLKDAIKKPGPNATAEEKAAYYKAIGRPEKPDDYKLDRPQGAPEPTEFEKQIEGDYLKQMYENGATQEQVAAGWKIYQRAVEAGKAKMEMEGAKLAEQTKDKLMLEWGPKEFRANMEVAERFLADTFGTEAGNLMSLKLHNGPALGALEPFVRGIVKLAKMHSDDGAVINGVTQEGVDIDKRVDELMSLKITDKSRYNSKPVQDELIKLIGIQNRRAANGQQRQNEHAR